MLPLYGWRTPEVWRSRRCHPWLICPQDLHSPQRLAPVWLLRLIILDLLPGSLTDSLKFCLLPIFFAFFLFFPQNILVFFFGLSTGVYFWRCCFRIAVLLKVWLTCPPAGLENAEIFSVFWKHYKLSKNFPGKELWKKCVVVRTFTAMKALSLFWNYFWNTCQDTFFSSAAF